MALPQRKPGRPPLPPAERRSVMLSFRVTQREAERLRAEARSRKWSVGDVIMSRFGRRV